MISLSDYVFHKGLPDWTLAEKLMLTEEENIPPILEPSEILPILLPPVLGKNDSLLKPVSDCT